MEIGVDYLIAERRKAQFDVYAMKVAWAGSKRALDDTERMARIVASDRAFRGDYKEMFSCDDLFKNTRKRAAHAWKLINELHLTEEEASMMRDFVDESHYGVLHWRMFIPAIKGQGTDEQQKKWLPLAQKMQIIGCYARTEVGQWWNVQDFETTATFDPKTDEFVIHSPTLTSRKLWPGGLGGVSTHAVVYARLIIDGKDYGVNGFIVQLRRLHDRCPFPGITVRDIGDKFGNGAYNAMGSGVLQFDHVRIPRDQMLMRIAHVTREGKFVQSGVPKQLLYETMVSARQTIVVDASKALSRAVSIATDYSVVRRQFGSQDGGPETQVIDDKTQQSRLFPLLASTYAFKFVGEWLNWLCADVTKRLQANDFSTLPEAEACTAGLKSLTTSVAADGIEECLKLSGLHDFVYNRRLPELITTCVPGCAFEGDNMLLLLQVARFLMKTVTQLESGKQPVGTVAYMGRAQHLMQARCTVNEAEDWLKPAVILEAFEARALRLAVTSSQNNAIASISEEGFSELSADLLEVASSGLLEVADAHCQLIVVSKFIEKVQQDIPGRGVKEMLQILCNVYALALVHEHVGDFISTGYITPKQGSLANQQLQALYSQVRPNTSALVDAFSTQITTFMMWHGKNQ